MVLYPGGPLYLSLHETQSSHVFFEQWLNTNAYSKLAMGLPNLHIMNSQYIPPK